jgi:hypothetical protein
MHGDFLRGSIPASAQLHCHYKSQGNAGKGNPASREQYPVNPRSDSRRG